MTRRNAALSGKALERFTRKLALQTRIAGRVGRRRKNLVDRLLTRLLDRVTRPRTPDDDFMRDEIVDAGIGFSADELERYQAGPGAGAAGGRDGAPAAPASASARRPE